MDSQQPILLLAPQIFIPKVNRLRQQYTFKKIIFSRNLQLTKEGGNVVKEKEWRRQNLEWERRRREAEKDAEFR